MVVATDCLPQVHACAMRITALDTDGSPHIGASAQVVIDSFSIVSLTPVYTDANEIDVKNACDATAINYKGAASFKRLDIALTLLKPDPFVHEIITSGGAALLTPGAGGFGFSYPAIGQVGGAGVAIELWAKRIDDGALDSTNPYAWWLIPRVQNARLGQRDFSNTEQTSPLTAEGYENPQWLDGPSNDWPVASDRVAQWVPTSTLPTAACGFAAVAST